MMKWTMSKKNDLRKRKIQSEALQSWIDAGKIGTLQIITGLGKTFIALDALRTMDKGSTHLFLAETTERRKDLIVQINEYDEMFNTNLLDEYKLEFYCYQTAYKWKGKAFGLVIADEIHDSLSPAYSQFYYNNDYDCLLGLSATIEKETRYEINGRIFSKGQLLEEICPIVYTYGLDAGQRDGTSRVLKIYVIQNKLDNVNKNVLAGSAKKRFFQTEKAAYDYWDKAHKQAYWIEDSEMKSLKLRITSQKRSKLLYDLKSKIPIVKTLINTVEGKVILFGNSIDALLAVTPDVVSSRNKDAKNDLIRANFESGKIKTIGSFKKLKQGANLSNIDNCIIMSYYSVEKDLIQRIGRLRDDGTIGRVFIIVTDSTKEIDWFGKMFADTNNFKFEYFASVEHYLNTWI